MKNRSYPSKVLLFGEYAIIRGSRALAIPFRDFEGRWAFSDTPPLSGLEGFLDYLEEESRSGRLTAAFDFDRFRADLGNGLYFDSSIPSGYGLGSSGAVVAAVYEAYARQPESELPLLKPILAQMESFFHGSSSGLDPLVCLLDRSFLVEDRQEIAAVEIPSSEPGKGALFILDTGISRETGPLVRIFLSKCEDLSFDARVEDELGSLSNAAIKAFLHSDWQVLQHVFGAISQFQWQYFQEMIPEGFRYVWAQGLESPLFKLKLCGAGGGGFLLGFAPDFEAARDALHRHPIRLVHGWR